MFALAGLAEAAMGAQIAVTWFGLFLVGGMSLLAFSTGRLWIHITVLFLAFVFGVCLVPWEVPFTTLTAKNLRDPDVARWFGRFRNLAYVCYVVMAFVLFNFIQFVVRKPALETQPLGESSPANSGS